MVPIGVITYNTFGTFLAPSIAGKAVRALFHIRFTVARNLRFIASTLTIREHMGIVTFETNGIVVRVLSIIMPTLYLRRTPRIGSVQRMVGIILEVEDIENALESIARSINKQYWRSHLSDTLLIQHQITWTGKFRDRTLGQPLEDIYEHFKG